MSWTTLKTSEEQGTTLKTSEEQETTLKTSEEQGTTLETTQGTSENKLYFLVWAGNLKINSGTRWTVRGRWEETT